MKKTKFLLFALSWGISMGLFTACSSEEDNPVVPDLIHTDKTPVGVELIDLGLPSGTKWANMNIGATTPEGYGAYFAWGETTGYSTDVSDGHLFNFESYKWHGNMMGALSKYNGNANGDMQTVLDLGDDAARANWGGLWVMPTPAEITELLDNTTSELITVNGINVRQFTSILNGKSIILPRAGYRLDNELKFCGEYGLYWSSWVSEDNAINAQTLYRLQGGPLNGNHPRFYGLQVRAVIRK